MNAFQFNLEEYIIRSAVNGVTDHLISAKVDNEGNVSFLITDASTDPYICEFGVYGNILASLDYGKMEECDMNGVPLV